MCLFLVYMLKKNFRLTKKKDFNRLATHGRSIFGIYSTLRINRNNQNNKKIGFIISTKIFKRAVKRNRAKRRYREIIKKILPQIPNNYHYLFILKPKTLDADFQKMEQDVLHMISKIDKTFSKPLKISPRTRKEIKKGKLPIGKKFIKPKNV